MDGQFPGLGDAGGNHKGLVVVVFFNTGSENDKKQLTECDETILMGVE